MIELKSRRMKVTLIVVGALLICGLGGFLGISLSGGGGSIGANIVAKATDMLFLVKPVFAQGAGTTFLHEEAGMSIYTDIGQSANLSVVKTLFETIEKETPDYIVGSFSLPNLPETDDVHCFVHKNGWIVVYYLKAEPVSKIIDWSYYSPGNLTRTKLHVGLEEMCNPLGVSATDINYYHFQYPYANKWMIIVDNDSFNLKIPAEFTIYERSYSHYCDGQVQCGQITASQLSPDVFHAIDFSYNSYYDYDCFMIDGATIDTISSVYTGNHQIAIILLYKES